MRTKLIDVVLLCVLILPFEGLTQSLSPDPYPLRPPDTSSPRDTLRSFLTDANTGIQLWHSGVSLTELVQQRPRAVQALDFSQIVDQHLIVTQLKHALLLKEILDRIPLPPDDQIPGDPEVADRGITRWTIPDTPITIAQVQDGARQGEFLFAAGTVQQLEEIYLRSKHLPYQPGATEGVYDKFLEAEGLSATVVSQIRNLLRPLDTSDPRSTYTGFRQSLNHAYQIIMEADAASQSTPPGMSRRQLRQAEKAADRLLRRAMSTLDLSRIPQAIRHDLGIAVALQLKEVLDRVARPYLEAIPDAEVVRDWKLANKDVLAITPRPFSWQFPNTAIEIVEVQDGPRAGEFLFSAGTVGQAGAFYRTAQELPYRPGATEGFYTFFTSTPGYLIPGAYPLTGWMTRVVDSLPAAFMTLYGEQTVWQWIGLALSFLVIFGIAVLIFLVVRGLSKLLPEPLPYWLKLLVPITVALTVMVAHEFVNHGLNITGMAFSIVTQVFEIIRTLMIVWAVFALCKAVVETVIHTPHIPDESIDASLLRLAARIVGFLVGAWMIIQGVQGLGVDVVPLLAGLGIGGLAVALAAQPTIANLIGGLILFADKPVRVGDFCRYGDQIGTVEHIGLRSTRVRSLERTIVAIPNASFSEMQLDNFAVRDRRLLRTTLQLRYETTPEQLRYVLAKLRELLLAHPMVTPEPARVRFAGYADYSKNVDIFAYLCCQDQNIFLAIQEDLLLRIEDIITEAGTGFAFPSQTAYLGRDQGLDGERGREAENQVAAWRQEGQLPFPEFEATWRESAQDALSYPPEGSPDYQPNGAVPDEPVAKETQDDSQVAGMWSWLRLSSWLKRTNDS